MDALIQYLNSISAGAALGLVVAIISAVSIIYTWLQKYRRTRNDYDKVKDNLKDNEEKISNQEKNLQQFEQQTNNQISQLQQTDGKIDEKLDSLIDSVNNLQIYQKKKDMHDLKDRILHNYKIFLERKELNNGVPFLTEREKEALYGLIESYTQAGGNSFIRDTIAPAILTWQILSEQDFREKMLQEKKGD